MGARGRPQKVNLDLQASREDALRTTMEAAELEIALRYEEKRGVDMALDVRDAIIEAARELSKRRSAAQGENGDGKSPTSEAESPS